MREPITGLAAWLCELLRSGTGHRRLPDRPIYWMRVLVFATGFAPFRDGPLQYAKNQGVRDITRTLGD
jgi:hypothetical protein